MSELARYQKKVEDQQAEIRALKEKIEGLEEVNRIAAAWVSCLGIKAGDRTTVPRREIRETIGRYALSVTVDQEEDQYVFEVSRRE